MKSILVALAFVVAVWPVILEPISSSQDSSSKIVGTWKSLDKENGQPLAEVTIKTSDGKLTGSVLLRDLVYDGKKVPQEFPMDDLAFEGKTLSFTLTFTDAGNKLVTAWELLLRENEEARLAAVKENDKQIEDGPVFVLRRVKTD
jgi:hypothetical protein